VLIKNGDKRTDDNSDAGTPNDNIKGIKADLKILVVIVFHVPPCFLPSRLRNELQLIEKIFPAKKLQKLAEIVIVTVLDLENLFHLCVCNLAPSARGFRELVF